MARSCSHAARIGVGLVLLSAAACEGESDTQAGSDERREGIEQVATAAGGDGRVAEGSSAIVGGHAEPGRSAVVAIVYDDNPAYDVPPVLVCSGVLITPTIVVTAAHCMHPHLIGYEPEELHVVFGPDIATGRRAAVLSGAYSPQWRIDDPNGEADIGALRLMEPAEGVDPIALGPAPKQGGRVVLVGYGGVEAGVDGEIPGAGTKRSGEALVGEVGGSWFRVERAPSTTCTGDSGGATLADIDGAEVLLGIHSRGDCVSELWNERLDAHANGFLKGFMGEYGGCNADGACAMGCPDPDPDCPCAADGKCDVACGEGEDPDCREKPCENLPPDGASVDCCDGGACDNDDSSSGAGWGSAGCAVETSGASRADAPASAGLVVSALGLLSLAYRRRRR